MSSPIKYLLETRDELKKVVWPKRAEVVRLTGVVIIISVAVGAYVGGLDFVFTKLMGNLLK
jgi:preprotein translocase subunit SecE